MSVGSDGAFSFSKLEDGNYTVTASFIGYTSGTQSVNIADGKAQTVDFTLTPVAQSIDEVVVIGYGTARKKT
ncbi:carboxypeptidase-like regulatory domain-containing protein [Niabella hibiscisoli]|uniref:carboxypeptidase-like regulatory domain-containing protein n=1 Tax=Niabella hibiscisoli TaxID=1825928 RepID=UPI001F108DEC|nr:carboxypeptidase-like regulatory domain-containing protein [Niabella hibiscisoli]MCH5715203.1 carboxypeptidase-like regulatory domain-containing protein [Niabella hibiscisoli]